MSYKTIQLLSDLEVSYIGPNLEKGALPAVFYFALSAEESLNVDPYNQPALFFLDYPIRVFSLDLPAHGKGQKAVDAITVWAKEMSQGKDPISEFIDKATLAIETLLEKGHLIEDKIGLMGLSRGGLIACHVASKLSYLRHILCFAPLTDLALSKEFQGLKEDHAVKKLNLRNLTSTIFDRSLRFYIGNRDVRVSTSACFHFMESLVETAFQHQIRSPQIEMFITPSIGQFGHGTSKESFISGAQWLAEELKK